jgi:hypothetical protein
MPIRKKGIVMLKLTQAQLDALYQVYLRWQNTTPREIMPEEFEIVTEKEYRSISTGDYIGLWVGEADEADGILGHMYLGIESDGHTHS